LLSPQLTALAPPTHQLRQRSAFPATARVPRPPHRCAKYSSSCPRRVIHCADRCCSVST